MMAHPLNKTNMSTRLPKRNNWKDFKIFKSGFKIRFINVILFCCVFLSVQTLTLSRPLDSVDNLSKNLQPIRSLRTNSSSMVVRVIVSSSSSVSSSLGQNKSQNSSMSYPLFQAERLNPEKNPQNETETTKIISTTQHYENFISPHFLKTSIEATTYHPTFTQSQNQLTTPQVLSSLRKPTNQKSNHNIFSVFYNAFAEEKPIERLSPFLEIQVQRKNKNDEQDQSNNVGSQSQTHLQRNGKNIVQTSSTVSSTLSSLESTPETNWTLEEKKWADEERSWGNAEKEFRTIEKPEIVDEENPPVRFYEIGEDEGDEPKELILDMNSMKTTVESAQLAARSWKLPELVKIPENTFMRSAADGSQTAESVQINEKRLPQFSGQSKNNEEESAKSSSGKKFGYVLDGSNVRKYRVEERTPDGFIVGEYGVINHNNGFLRGVRYTADGTINPRLIHEALMKFLTLK